MQDPDLLDRAVAEDWAGQLAVETLLSYAQSCRAVSQWLALGKALGWSLDETKAYAMRAMVAGISAVDVASVLTDPDGEPLRVQFS